MYRKNPANVAARGILTLMLSLAKSRAIPSITQRALESRSLPDFSHCPKTPQSLTVILRGLTRSDFGSWTVTTPCSICALIFAVSMAGSNSNARR